MACCLGTVGGWGDSGLGIKWQGPLFFRVSLYFGTVFRQWEFLGLAVSYGSEASSIGLLCVGQADIEMPEGHSLANKACPKA